MSSLSTTIFAFVCLCLIVSGYAVNVKTKDLASLILQESSSSIDHDKNAVSVSGAGAGAGSASLSAVSVSVSGLSYHRVTVSSSDVFFPKYTWFTANDGSRMTIHAGAYFKTKFTGPTFGFQLDQSGAWTDCPYIMLEVNIDGEKTRVVVPDQLTSPNEYIHPVALGSGVHSALVTITAVNSPSVPRWNPPQLFLRVVAVITASGESLSPPDLRKHTLLFYGDSSGEGMEVETIDHNKDPWSLYMDDALKAYAHFIAKETDSEISFCALDGVGYTLGNLDVPPFIVPEDPTEETWDYYWHGESRLDKYGEYIGGSPTYVVIAIGTTDDSPYKVDVDKTKHRAALALRLIAKAAPQSHIYVLIPFGHFRVVELTAVYNEYKAAGLDPDNRVHLIDLGEEASYELNGKIRHPWASLAKKLGTEVGQQIAATYFP